MSERTRRKALRFDAEEHRYFWQPKGTLKERELIGITRMLEIVGVRPPFFGEDDSAARFGTKAHKMIALWLRGRLNEKALHPRLVARLDAVKKFVRESKFRPYQKTIEQKVVDPIIGVAGTFDVLGFAFGKKAIIDWKTGTAIGAWMELQTAGYLHCVRREGIWIERDESVGRFAVQLLPDGNFKLYEHKSKSDPSSFAGAVCLAWWKIRRGFATIRKNEEQEGTLWLRRNQPMI